MVGLGWCGSGRGGGLGRWVGGWVEWVWSGVGMEWMEWSGVEWRGEEWSGVEWSGVEWGGVERGGGGSGYGVGSGVDGVGRCVGSGGGESRCVKGVWSRECVEWGVGGHQ